MVARVYEYVVFMAEQVTATAASGWLPRTKATHLSFATLHEEITNSTSTS